MKRSASIIGIVAVFVAACAATGKPIAENEMGLSRTSVFEDPSPEVFQYPETKPAAATALPVAWDGAPPQIPHDIDAYLPIKADANACLDCHDKPANMGKKEKGRPTAMPESHYTKVEDKWERSNSRYVCTQCHAPQASVKDLVGNSFGAH
jgi:cytochrome c-type protein NapB